MAINNFGPPQSSPSTGPSGTYTPDRYESGALSAIGLEMSTWHDEEVFLTDRISYVMRNVILRTRKNYYGIFDNAYDEVTGQEKFWVPVTEWSVENVVKSIDLDMKDITIQPGTPAATKVTPIVRAIVMTLLKKLHFGQLLNDVTRSLARDGTAVVKVFDDIDPGTGKRFINVRPVDLLNIWIDPNAASIQDSSAFIERSYMTKDEIESYRGTWSNLDELPYSLNVPDVFQDWGGWSLGRGNTPQTEIYERWGKIRKSWVTKDMKDEDTWIDGHMVFGGQSGAQVVLHVRENPRKDGRKPYEECWYKRVDGRWFGRGVAEMLFQSQEYSNEIVNTRRNNNQVLQNGLFLIRRGIGLSPDVLNSLTAGGGIYVSDINRDIKQLNTEDYRASSYADEDRVNTFVDRQTGSFDINRGEAGQASTSATATLTQDRHIRDTFILVQEGMGDFIERLIVNQFIPLVQKTTKPGDIIRLTGDMDSLEDIDNTIIESRKNNFILQRVADTSFMPDPAEIEEFVAKEREALTKQGKNRFAEYFREIFDPDIDVDVSITDERINRVVMIQQLQQMLVGFSRLPVATRLNTDAIIEEMLNLMGIKGEFFLNNPQVPSISGDASQVGRFGKNPPEGVPTEQGALANAAGLPSLGQGVPPQTTAIPAAAGETQRAQI